MKLNFNFKKEFSISKVQLKTTLLNGGRKTTRQRKRSSKSFRTPRASEPCSDSCARLKKDPRIGHTTVYRTMKLLTELGLAAQRKFADGETRYEPISGQEHHDHFICVGCGKSLNLRTRRLRPYRRGLQNGFDSRPFIIGWSSTDDAPIAGQGKKIQEKGVRNGMLDPWAPSTNPSTEKVILIGNPNVGKSVIFNYLTGKYVTVSNYPGPPSRLHRIDVGRNKRSRSSTRQALTPSFPCQRMKRSPGISSSMNLRPISCR